MSSPFRGTTICAVTRNGQTAIAGDGQVTMGENTIFKTRARKVRRLYDGKIAIGFAGSVADAFTLCEKFEEKHGLRHLKLHGLRHTCASLMMLLGADAETVRDVLGHDSVRTTDIYLHPYEDGKKRAAGLVGSVIGEVFHETENIACDSRENA